MRRLLKFAVVGLAIVGIAAIALTVYLNFFLPLCSLYRSANVQSADGKYVAVFEQSTCEDPSRSRASVTMWKSDSPDERIVWMDIEGTNDVALTWSRDGELIVRLPSEARTRKYGPYAGFPRVVERRGSGAADAT
jgi:hypothetical protein